MMIALFSLPFIKSRKGISRMKHDYDDLMNKRRFELRSNHSWILGKNVSNWLMTSQRGSIAGSSPWKRTNLIYSPILCNRCRDETETQIRYLMLFAVGTNIPIDREISFELKRKFSLFSETTYWLSLIGFNINFDPVTCIIHHRSINIQLVIINWSFEIHDLNHTELSCDSPLLDHVCNIRTSMEITKNLNERKTFVKNRRIRIPISEKPSDLLIGIWYLYIKFNRFFTKLLRSIVECKTFEKRCEWFEMNSKRQQRKVNETRRLNQWFFD